MCGIAGYFDYRGQFLNSSEHLIKEMTQAINHRGPDYQGEWLSEDRRLILGHQRLSIIDLSIEGNQPMLSSSGRYVLVFNGEIYNFKKLKNLLNFKDWRGSSDSEVLLQVIEEKGLNSALPLIEGMFAIALWDKKKNELSLVRDRLGEKPLYYGVHNHTFLFASELKGIKAHPAFCNELDNESASLYFKYGYIPGNKSIYKNISKVLPGEILTFDFSSEHFSTTYNGSYWNLSDSIDEASKINVSDNLSSLTDQLETLLTDVIRDESIADVPLGSFLSGGIDSSLITSILQRESGNRIETFSIGYLNKDYDESNYARSVAKHLKTKHNELILDANDLKNTIPKVPKLFDEPFGDPSSVPTFIVSDFAKTKLKVCLSGDGGDELFGGYTRYIRSQNIWSKINLIPETLRNLTSKAIQYPANLGFKSDYFMKLQRLQLYLKCNSLADIYQLQSQIPDSEINNFLNIKPSNVEVSIPSQLSEFERMLYVDLKTYLPDDILVKVDRSAMAVSLETRAPFLNHKVVEFAFSLPVQFKYHDKLGKVILRKLLERHMPLDLFDRPKMGFGIPIDEWIKSDLRDWALDNLSNNQLQRSGIFKPEIIRKRLEEHIQGTKKWHYFLWKVLMFIEWQNHNQISYK